MKFKRFKRNLNGMDVPKFMRKKGINKWVYILFGSVSAMTVALLGFAARRERIPMDKVSLRNLRRNLPFPANLGRLATEMSEEFFEKTSNSVPRPMNNRKKQK